MRLNFATLLLVVSANAMHIEKVDIEEEQVENLAEVEVDALSIGHNADELPSVCVDHESKDYQEAYFNPPCNDGALIENNHADLCLQITDKDECIANEHYGDEKPVVCCWVKDNWIVNNTEAVGLPRNKKHI